MVAQGLEEPSKAKCSCRQYIPYKEANQKVKNGEASWVVVKRERDTQTINCPMCKADSAVKNCAQCNGTGTIVKSVVWDTYNNDIVLVSQASVDKREKKYRPALAMKTPRVATIESKHIERAYVADNTAAQKRIDEYGRLIHLQLGEYGAEVRIKITGKAAPDQRVIHPGTAEPQDVCRSYPPGSITFKDGSTNKNWWWVVEGRELDYGRTI